MFEKYKKEIIIILIIVIIPLILIGLYSVFKNPVSSKSTKNGDMPYINVGGKDTKAINEYIDNIYKTYGTNKFTKISYKTSINNNIVSVLIDINLYNEDIKDYTKKFIGFNVKKDGTFLDKEELASIYGYSLVEIIDRVENRLKAFYEDEAIKGYIEKEECDFNCYLSYARGINNILDEISLVIENNKLVVYINLSKDDINGDKAYFESLEEPYKLILE